MSIRNIESDYTPNDFLEKLLGKSFTPEAITEDNLKLKTENSNSQSTIEDTTCAQVLNPKSNQVQRIHFHSVQNIPRTQLIDTDFSKQDLLMPSYEFKENIRKKSLRKQNTQTLSAKEITLDAKRSGFNQESTTFTSVSNKEVFYETQQQLILRKTKLILKSILKNKVNDKEISSILGSLQNGITNATEFDKLVSSENIEPNEVQVENKEMHSAQGIKTKRSKSTNLVQRGQIQIRRRVRSCQRAVKVSISKNQEKKRRQQGKHQLLKSIKKMKQLVFLNQKSLKRTRRA